jgi:hypothetical protein
MTLRWRSAPGGVADPFTRDGKRYRPLPSSRFRYVKRASSFGLCARLGVDQSQLVPIARIDHEPVPSLKEVFPSRVKAAMGGAHLLEHSSSFP